MHEVSNLVEDLNTISKYFEKLGKQHPDHQLWKDCRDHIRHDIREEFDESEERKTQRAKRLNINEKLQSDIRFHADCLQFGETKVELRRVEAYLDWADSVILEELKQARAKGLLK